MGNKYYSTSTITRSFATGDVTATDYAGGFVGKNYTEYGGDREDFDITSATIEKSYSVGSIIGATNKGGFVGLNDSDGVITNSYYDKTLVIGMSDEAEFGQTTEDLKDLAFFEDAGWGIQQTDQLSDVYPQLSWMAGTTGTSSAWVIGEVATPNNSGSSSGGDSSSNSSLSSSSSSSSSSTPATTTPTVITSPATSTQEPTQQEEIADIITPILNGTRTVVNAPQVTIPQSPTQAPRVQAQTTMATSIGLGNNARIVSTTNIGEQADTIVSLGELQQSNGGAGEVRVPLSDNSIVDLVNGGVNLPDGVEQQFFVVANDEN